MTDSFSKGIRKTVLNLFLILLLFWSLFPILWLFLTSIRPNLGPLQAGNPFFFRPYWGNYAAVLQNHEIIGYFFNSLLVGFVSTILSLVLGTFAAYGLARFHFRGQRLCKQWILSIRLLPPIGFVIPLFIMFKTLQMLDTRLTLIIVYTAFLLPFSIWMLTGAIKEIPKEAEEAALIDGCTHVQVLLFIILPELKPALTAVGLLNLVAAWNEFLYALILTGSKAVTLPVAITSFLGDKGIYWGEITAAAVLTAIIPVCLLFGIRKNLMKGLGMGLQ